jgi:myo-inositol-1(or 4)-monophosphatase
MNCDQPAINEGETLRFVLDLIGETGERLLENFHGKEGTRGRKKGDGSLLTEADIESNDLITRRISERFPEHGLLTEEGDTVAPDGPCVWIVDPLDGTTNFARGIPLWCISIALYIKGEIRLGAVAFPALHRIYRAIKGKGAFLNENPIGPGHLLGQMETQVFVTCTHTLKNYSLTIPLKLRILGSAAYNLIAVAEGTAACGMEHRPKIWDIAAASLIIEEAGHIIDYPFSEPFFPLKPCTDYSGLTHPLITANNMGIYKAMLRWIRPLA